MRRILVPAGAFALVLIVWASVMLVHDKGERSDADDPLYGVSRAQFHDLELGTSRAVTEQRFGPPEPAEYPPPFGATPPGITCDFHAIIVEADLPIPGYLGEVRLCFRGAGERARLVERAWSDGECVFGRSTIAADLAARCP